MNQHAQHFSIPPQQQVQYSSPQQTQYSSAQQSPAGSGWSQAYGVAPPAPPAQQTQMGSFGDVRTRSPFEVVEFIRPLEALRLRLWADIRQHIGIVSVELLRGGLQLPGNSNWCGDVARDGARLAPAGSPMPARPPTRRAEMDLPGVDEVPTRPAVLRRRRREGGGGRGDANRTRPRPVSTVSVYAPSSKCDATSTQTPRRDHKLHPSFSQLPKLPIFF